MVSDFKGPDLGRLVVHVVHLAALTEDTNRRLRTKKG